MTMNSQWSSSFNPPEPVPFGAKSIRDSGFSRPDSGFGGGGLSGISTPSISSSSSNLPRQITKNPLNMIGMGNSNSLGLGNSGSLGMGTSGSLGMGNSGNGMGNSSGIVREYGLGGYGDRDRQMVMGKMPPTSNQGNNFRDNNLGQSYTSDGYGMGAMGNRNTGRGSPGSNNYSNGYSNGMYNGSMRDMMGRQESREPRGPPMGRDPMQGNREGMGNNRDMMGPRPDMMGPRGDMMGSNRDIMGSNRDMMGSNRDMMGSNRDMMGGPPGRDVMGLARELMGSRDVMGSNRDMMEPRDMNSFSSQRDMMGHPRGMGERSMSMTNGSMFGNGMGGNDMGGFNRSMSYHGGPGSNSPPQSDMKIGTWNDGQQQQGQQQQSSGGGFRNESNQFGNGAGPGPGGPGGAPTAPSFEIGTFNMNDPGGRSFGGPAYSQTRTSNGTSQSNVGPIQPGMGIKETGIIEKLLHSYGFIQCCDRQARLFFHFSQFDGNIEHLKIGDPVEFEMTYDRRTGKPIASLVSKIAPEIVMSEERVIGVVTTEVKINPDGGETAGRISYENRGECFFLPFNTMDVEGNVTVTSRDKVSFQMATVQRTGNLAAKTIRLENPAAPVKYQGVVNSLKDSFGFIERADVVKEIFFHFSEVVDGKTEDNSHAKLGDDVEFNIQTRNGKEVACNLIKLTPGTVIFEDVGTEYLTGQVLKPLDKAGKYQQTDALPGRVKFRAVDRSEVEIPFGEKDQVGDFTLRHGDWVKFVIATDRRDKLRRATKIELLDESFKVSDERREQGIVQTLKEGFGFMKCVDRNDKMFFHFSECLDVSKNLSVGDEVEFTVCPDPAQPPRLLATRIKHLPANSVKFDIVIAQNILGVVAEEPAAVSWAPRSPSKAPESPNSKEGSGRIVYELNGLQLSIPLYAADCDLRNTPKKGDKVQFDINQLKATKETNAVNIRVLERVNPDPARAETASNASSSPPRDTRKDKEIGIVQLGYVAALKDGFGFIETLKHDKEIFFHFSNVEGKAEKLEVGQEVEYSIYSREKGGKVSAEGVKPVSKGSIKKVAANEEIFNGKVVRPLRSVNPDQSDYCGLIQARNEDGTVIGEYEFGIASLLNKKELLQEGDPVNFQVSSLESFALNIKSNKQKLRSHVEAVKGQFGFLSYEKEEGKKLFFHMSEVEGGDILNQGDEVEFVVVTNQRTRKHSACCVRKLCVSKRPERLISKLKTMNIEENSRGGPKIIVVRQPRGPDGTKGFKPRSDAKEKTPEIVMDLMEQLTAQ